MKQSPTELQLIQDWLAAREVPRHKPGVSGIPTDTRCQWGQCRLPAGGWRMRDKERIPVCQGHSYTPPFRSSL